MKKFQLGDSFSTMVCQPRVIVLGHIKCLLQEFVFAVPAITLWKKYCLMYELSLVKTLRILAGKTEENIIDLQSNRNGLESLMLLTRHS